ncbi:hypothetical protein PG990_006753 [Apiospora arundinis]|uniref:N-acetyltransferase ESCO zinc-finger domain-containing protein n=1 Tax=Apiospora arundinis TaxID=335852 RepID=A0ABR2JB29_9PEZI
MDRDAPSSRVASRPQLRTYSKRTTPRDDSEPPAKKQRTSDVARPKTDSAPSKVTPEKPAMASAKAPKTRQPELPTQRPVEPPKKGTIMSYFKVTSPSSGNATPCETSSDALCPPSTPPSSPPLLLDGRKKRRRLTTKPAYQTTPDPEEDEEERDASEPTTDNGSAKRLRTMVLGEVAALKLNEKDKSEEESRSEAGKRGANKKKKAPKPKTATVQTTLVLSLNETGFVECQECNMLYNSLHEKDVKLHARRHAAVLRKAKMGIAETD